MRNAYNIVLFLFVIFTTTTLYSSELAFRNQTAETVKNLFMNENFAELEYMAEKYRNSLERTNSGLWKLTTYYFGFDGFTRSKYKDEDYWHKLKIKANKWVQEYPESQAAHNVKGIILNGYAWKFRGGDWANKVAPESWKPFKENLLLAREHMVDSKNVASQDPHWYVVTADILKGLGVDSESFSSLIEEGLNEFPYYYQIYFSAVSYLAPRWHGDKAKIEEFANHAVIRTQNEEGMSLYARIYWFASQTHYDENLFRDSNIVWSNMKQGIFDVVKSYPDEWNIQNFAFFSCLSGDQDTTRILFDQISTPMIRSAWSKGRFYNQCKEFAYQ